MGLSSEACISLLIVFSTFVWPSPGLDGIRYFFCRRAVDLVAILFQVMPVGEACRSNVSCFMKTFSGRIVVMSAQNFWQCFGYYFL